MGFLSALASLFWFNHDLTNPSLSDRIVDSVKRRRPRTPTFTEAELMVPDENAANAQERAPPVDAEVMRKREKELFAGFRRDCGWVWLFKVVFGPCLYLSRYSITFQKMAKYVKVKETHGNRFAMNTMLSQTVKGILAGLCCGFGVYYLLMLSNSRQMPVNLYFSANVLALAALATTYSSTARCIVLLCLPDLMAGRLRWIIFLIICILTASGPFTNLLKNLRVIQNSLGCLLDQLATNGMKLEQSINAPFASTVHHIYDWMNKVSNFKKRMKGRLSDYISSLNFVHGMVSKTKRATKSLASKCSNEEELLSTCYSTVRNLRAKCFNDVWYGMKTIVCSNFGQPVIRFCDEAMMQSFGKCGDMILKVEDAVGLSKFSGQLTKVKELQQPVHELLGEEEIKLVGYEVGTEKLNFNVTGNLTAHLKAELVKVFTVFTTAQHILNVVAGFIAVSSIIYTVLKAVLFARSWKRKLAFKNIYLMDEFVHQEYMAFKLGLTNTLPLSLFERMRYCRPGSFKIVKAELLTGFKNCIPIIVLLVSTLLIIGADYILFMSITNSGQVYEYAKSKFGGIGEVAPDPYDSHVKDARLVAEGDTPVAQITQEGIDVQNQENFIDIEIEPKRCKPIASPIDAQNLENIAGLFGFAFFSVILQKEKLGKFDVILASGSPRRKELLEQLGLKFSIHASNVAEDLDPKQFNSPADFVEKLAIDKVEASMLTLPAHPGPRLLIAADTVILLQGKVVGKPACREEAIRTLLQLSACKQHSVLTGVCLCWSENGKSRSESFSERTEVFFTDLTQQCAEAYVDSGEPLDKAGSYGIQGLGGTLVERIEGDYYNVVGLPLNALCKRISRRLNDFA